MKINSRGYWENDTAEGHGHDAGLAKALWRFFEEERARSIVDIGCGDGFYTNYLFGMTLNIEGFDGNPNTSKIAGLLCDTLDFSKPIVFPFLYDWALCLEVGEHIPAEFEETFINNVANSCTKGLVISWAIPGQGGDGHVNCKTNDEVREIFTNKGFKLSPGATNILRDSVANYPHPCYWFSYTLQVFRKI